MGDDKDSGNRWDPAGAGPRPTPPGAPPGGDGGDTRPLAADQSAEPRGGGRWARVRQWQQRVGVPRSRGALVAAGVALALVTGLGGFTLGRVVGDEGEPWFGRGPGDRFGDRDDAGRDGRFSGPGRGPATPPEQLGPPAEQPSDQPGDQPGDDSGDQSGTPGATTDSGVRTTTYLVWSSA